MEQDQKRPFSPATRLSMGVRFRILISLLIAVLSSTGLYARTSTRSAKTAKRDGRVTESPRAQKRLARLRRVRRAKNVRLRRHHRYYEHFYTSSYATDITDGDLAAGEDQTVRQAAIDALGDMNGTLVAIDPTSGRVLTMVNQKLALSEGAQPCSTIK